MESNDWKYKSKKLCYLIHNQIIRGCLKRAPFFCGFQEGEGRRHRAKGTGHRAQGKGHRAKGAGQRAQGKGHRAKGTGQRAKGAERGGGKKAERITHNVEGRR